MDYITTVLFLSVIVMLILSTNRANFVFYKFLRKRKGDIIMANAEMIMSLLGKNVRISDMILGRTYKGTVLEIEEKWLKIDVGNPKKGTKLIKILAIDSIGSVDLI